MHRPRIGYRHDRVEAYVGNGGSRNWGRGCASVVLLGVGILSYCHAFSLLAQRLHWVPQQNYTRLLYDMRWNRNIDTPAFQLVSQLLTSAYFDQTHSRQLSALFSRSELPQVSRTITQHDCRHTSRVSWPHGVNVT